MAKLDAKVAFESATQRRVMAQDAFDAAAPALRLELVRLQQKLRAADFPVLIVLEGVYGAGKSEFIQLLNEWMDPRWLITHAYPEEANHKPRRPVFWRYWQDLIPDGQIGIYLSAWYSEPLRNRAYKRIGKKKFAAALDDITEFERTLSDDGVLILKYWFHLGKAAQKRRLKALEKNPLRHWQVKKRDWADWKRYDAFADAGEAMIERTDTATVPWKIVNGSDPCHRCHTVLTDLRDRLSAHLKARGQAARRAPKSPPSVKTVQSIPEVLANLDLSKTISKENYGREIKRLRARLHGLYLQAKKEKVATVVLFEGWDAAGKGGCIRRLTSGLDARDYRIFPFAAPNDEERAHHYLWRFWRQVPKDGHIAIYDRSWYGRVLVERVEGFAQVPEWRRAYREIGEFERDLTDHGIVLMKFWLHIDRDEQHKRFRERETTSFKRWKISQDDWRNRARWDDYETAANEMFERTSTAAAPWHLIEANSKPFARLKVIRTVCDMWEARLKD